MLARGAKEELAILLPNTMSNYLPHRRDAGRLGLFNRVVVSVGVVLGRLIGGAVGFAIREKRRLQSGQALASASHEQQPANDRRFIGRTSAA